MKDITFIVTARTARGFGYKGSADLVRVPLQVDLSKLSPTALDLAQAVYSLENADDLSKVWVVGPTQRELFIKEEKLEDLELYKKVFPSEDLDKPTKIVWHWDCLRGTETPEEYFERHGEMIKEAGGYQICRFSN